MAGADPGPAPGRRRRSRRVAAVAGPHRGPARALERLGARRRRVLTTGDDDHGSLLASQLYSSFALRSQQEKVQLGMLSLARQFVAVGDDVPGQPELAKADAAAASRWARGRGRDDGAAHRVGRGPGRRRRDGDVRAGGLRRLLAAQHEAVDSSQRRGDAANLVTSALLLAATHRDRRSDGAAPAGRQTGRTATSCAAAIVVGVARSSVPLGRRRSLAGLWAVTAYAGRVTPHAERPRRRRRQPLRVADDVPPDGSPVELARVGRPRRRRARRHHRRPERQDQAARAHRRGSSCVRATSAGACPRGRRRMPARPSSTAARRGRGGEAGDGPQVRHGAAR